jgi:hypothetical protein
MRSNHDHPILPKTALADELSCKLLNTLAMRNKGWQRLIKVSLEVIPEGLIGNATIDPLSIDYGQKPDNPSVFIIRFARRKFYRSHRHFLRYVYSNDGHGVSVYDVERR